MLNSNVHQHIPEPFFGARAAFYLLLAWYDLEGTAHIDRRKRPALELMASLFFRRVRANRWLASAGAASTPRHHGREPVGLQPIRYGWKYLAREPVRFPTTADSVRFFNTQRTQSPPLARRQGNRVHIGAPGKP